MQSVPTVLGRITNEIYPSDFNAVIFPARLRRVYSRAAQRNPRQTTTSSMICSVWPFLYPRNRDHDSLLHTGAPVSAYLILPARQSAIENGLFQLTPDGKGGIAAVTVNGQAANQSNSALSQTISGVTYSFGAAASARWSYRPPRELRQPMRSSRAEVRRLCNPRTETLFWVRPRRLRHLLWRQGPEFFGNEQCLVRSLFSRPP